MQVHLNAVLNVPVYILNKTDKPNGGWTSSRSQEKGAVGKFLARGMPLEATALN